MNRITTSTLLTLTCVLVGFACAAQITVIDSMQWNGVWHRFRAYVPAEKKCALVVHLHGYGSNSLLEMVYTGYMPVADTAGFVVAYPDGLVDPLGSQSWNVGWPLQVANDDVGYLSAFIDTMVNRYDLNPSAVFMSGLSNGGFMAFRLACELPGKVAAIANVSGSLTPTLFNNCAPTQAFPLMMIHGTADATIPYEGSTGFVASTHVDSVIEKYSTLFGCDTLPEITNLPHAVNTVNGTSVEHYIYDDCAQETSVELYKIINGEHVNWPGFDQSTTNDFSAAHEIWRFFRSYRSCESLSVPRTTNSLHQLYPNPSNGIFYLRFHQDVSVKSFRVCTLDGREIIRGASSSSNEIQIDLSNRVAGCYFLFVNAHNETFATKLMLE